MNLSDVLEMKKTLNQLGLYEIPPHGLTQYPDEAFIEAIRKFQNGNGLQPDGVMKPEGPTYRTMVLRLEDNRPDANQQMLHKLNERQSTHTRKDFKSNNMKGSYIWHTQGDGKVRESHAERDGKKFSWDNPPEGGHPGEDYNCRCWAEETDVDCDYLRRLIESIEINLEKANRDFDKANDKFEKAWEKLKELKRKCQNELAASLPKIGKSTGQGAAIGGMFGHLPGAISGGLRGAAEGAYEAARDVYNACIADMKNTPEQTAYDKALQERNSIEFRIKALQEELSTYREEYEQAGCKS
ncbi:MAG: phage minor head protein [Magnetovibrio sp.]|nr:phage minor head protein [Magnetovibrio sp.]